MRNSKTIIIVPMWLLMFSIGLFFTQCSDNKKLSFSEEIKQHFGDMNYREIIFPNSEGFDWQSDLQSVKGKDTIRNKLGKLIHYRWFFIEDKKGVIGGFYLGSDDLNSIGTVTMTHSEASRRYEICKKEQGESRHKCEDQLVADILNGCYFSSDEDCEKNCWFNSQLCGGE